MSTKTISITEEAYKRLANLKKENESFSEVINRVTGKIRLTDFHGILSKKSGEQLEKIIAELRRIDRMQENRKIKKIQGEL